MSFGEGDEDEEEEASDEAARAGDGDGDGDVEDGASLVDVETGFASTSFLLFLF